MSGVGPTRRATRPQRFLRQLLRWRRDRSGATAIEFGLIGLPFLAIVCAIFEVAYVDFENEMLAAAVTKAARAMLTGQTQAANITTKTQFVSTYLCPTTGPRPLPSNFNCSNLIVDVRTASSFVNGDMSNDFYSTPLTNQFCPGAPGQIVVVRVAYPLAAIFPLNLFSRTSGVVNNVPGLTGWYHILMGEALFQEELYGSSYAAPAGC